jgi:CDP-diacylglycerol--glycerol-3-phosphate 3-phosphatidyltransferase
VTVAETSFGPSALATPANLITIGRIALTPVLLALIVGPGDSWPAFVLWILLCVTDGLDGYLARRQGTTRSGAFLDPLADKFLVLGAMVALVVHHSFWWFPVALVALREIAMSVYRSYGVKQGVSIPARFSAKVKTVMQEVAVAFALLPLTGDGHPGVATTVLWVAVVLTLTSGVQYLADGRRQLRAV